jgi:hypothetical protein
MKRHRIEREKEEARRDEYLKNYEVPNYDTSTGGAWKPETLINYVKKNII